jgi:hypothetical protein
MVKFRRFSGTVFQSPDAHLSHPQVLPSTAAYCIWFNKQSDFASLPVVVGCHGSQPAAGGGGTAVRRRWPGIGRIAALPAEKKERKKKMHAP